MLSGDYIVCIVRHLATSVIRRLLQVIVYAMVMECCRRNGALGWEQGTTIHWKRTRFSRKRRKL